MNTENFISVQRSATVLCLKRSSPEMNSSFDELVRRKANSERATEGVNSSIEIVDGSFSEVRPIVESSTSEPPKKRRRSTKTMPSPAVRETPSAPNFAAEAVTSTPLPEAAPAASEPIEIPQEVGGGEDEDDDGNIVDDISSMLNFINYMKHDKEHITDFRRQWYADVRNCLREKCALLGEKCFERRAILTHQRKLIDKYLMTLIKLRRQVGAELEGTERTLKYCEDLVVTLPGPPDPRKCGEASGSEAADQ